MVFKCKLSYTKHYYVEIQRITAALLKHNLNYSYIGNRLNSVVNDAGFIIIGGGYSGGIMQYDSNGNMTVNPDKKMSIQYNFLNLPKSITTTTGGFITLNTTTHYLYRADGVKLAKYYNAPLASLKETNYLDGFQYDNSDNTTSLIVPPSLKFVPTSEGYFDYLKNSYIYTYTDHLGNVRLSYAQNGSGVEVLEENNYYPFGLKHEGYNNVGGNPAYQYKYNGKELQETGMYDYGARMYMSDIGRWGVVDPLAETSRRWSPYNYAYNNPIRFIDPDGMEAKDIWNFNINTGQLNKIEDNNEIDIVYAVNETGKRQTNKNGKDIKFTMERNNQIDEAYNTTVPVEYNPRPGETAMKDVNYKVINFDDQSLGKNFYDFLDKHSRAKNEFDMFQYNQNGQGKAAVGINGQNGYLPRYTQVSGKEGVYDFGAFIPSVSLMSGYYQKLSNLSGVDPSKNIFSHSHPGDNGNPEPSAPDIDAAKRSLLPGIFQVSSKGIYKIIPRQ